MKIIIFNIKHSLHLETKYDVSSSKMVKSSSHQHISCLRLKIHTGILIVNVWLSVINYIRQINIKNEKLLSK